MISILHRSAVALGLLLLTAGAARAGEVATLGDLAIVSPWARASIGTSRPAAAYLSVTNRGAESDTLVAVESPVAARAMAHRTTMDNGVMKMEPAGTVEIPPGETVTFKPGGLHIMLMKLRQPLKKGGTLTLTLRFERAGAVTIEAPIAGPGASGPPE